MESEYIRSDTCGKFRHETQCNYLLVNNIGMIRLGACRIDLKKVLR